VALFARTKATPAFGHAPIQAAAGSAAQIGDFYTYSVGGTEELGLSVPTIARAVQMICSVVGSLPLKHYTTQWTGEEYEEIGLELEAWMLQPDPTVTRQFIMSATVTDLMMRGEAFWYVTSRSQNTGRPLTFQWMPAAMVSLLDQTGPQRFGLSKQVTFNGVEIPYQDVVQFIAPTQGLLYTAARSIQTAVKLDRAADRFASTEIAAGYLQQTDGSEPMSAEDLAELAASWANARRASAIGALNSVVKWQEFNSDPSKLQLVESRQFQALELSRHAGIPPYLLGIGVPGSFTYQNAQQARQDLWLFGAKMYADCIEQTLSGNSIVPRGRFVKFDVEDFLFENSMAEIEVEEPASARVREDETV
jgi:phage portal protein BeeE